METSEIRDPSETSLTNSAQVTSTNGNINLSDERVAVRVEGGGWNRFSTECRRKEPRRGRRDAISGIITGWIRAKESSRESEDSTEQIADISTFRGTANDPEAARSFGGPRIDTIPFCRALGRREAKYDEDPYTTPGLVLLGGTGEDGGRRAGETADEAPAAVARDDNQTFSNSKLDARVRADWRADSATVCIDTGGKKKS